MTEYFNARQFIGELVGQDNTLTIPRWALTITGNDHLAAILMSQLMYWQPRTSAQNEYWIIKSAGDLLDELGMTAYQVTRAIAKLQKLGFPIEVKTAKSPIHSMAPTKHYQVDMDKAIGFVKIHYQETAKSESEETAKSYIETTSETTKDNAANPGGASEPEQRINFICKTCGVIPVYSDGYYFYSDGSYSCRQCPPQTEKPIHYMTDRRPGEVGNLLGGQFSAWQYARYTQEQQEQDGVTIEIETIDQHLEQLDSTTRRRMNSEWVFGVPVVPNAIHLDGDGKEIGTGRSLEEAIEALKTPPEHEPGTQRNAERIARGYPPGFFERTAGCLADDPIERGEQGEYEQRDDIFPMDENGHWDKSLTHPGMFQERVGETVHFPPVLTFLTHHAQNIAQLIIADRPVRFAKALDLTALEELRKAGYVKWPVIRGDGQTYTLTDTGKALADNPLVKGAVDAAKRKAGIVASGKAIGLTGTNGTRTKGKFQVTADHKPIFDELCNLFGVLPDEFAPGDWKFYAGLARDLFIAKASVEEVTAVYNWCKGKEWPKGFGPGALVKNLQLMRGEKRTATPEQNTTIIIDMSNMQGSE